MEAIDIEGGKTAAHPNDICTVAGQYNSGHSLSLHLEIKTRHGEEQNAFNSDSNSSTLNFQNDISAYPFTPSVVSNDSNLHN